MPLRLSVDVDVASVVTCVVSFGTRENVTSTSVTVDVDVVSTFAPNLIPTIFCPQQFYVGDRQCLRSEAENFGKKDLVCCFSKPLVILAFSQTLQRNRY